MNRRAFLHLSGLLAVGGLLEACGSAAAPAASSAAPPAPSSAAPAPSKPAAASAPASAKPAPSAAASASAKPAASAAGSAAAKPGSPKLIVTYGAPVGSFAPLWMAQAIGAFDKYGVSVDMRFVETNTAVTAQIAKEIDVQEVSAAPVITVDVNGNQDLVIIASALNHPILSLYALPSITNAAQLKGKAVGSDKAGTPVDYATQLALSLLGLKPTDVQLEPLGPTGVIAGLLSGQIPAGVIAPPDSFRAEAKGFKVLQDIISQPYQNVALVARKSRLDELSPGIKPLISAYRDGIAACFTQPDLFNKVQSQFAKVTDPNILKKNYDFYTKTAPYQKDMQPTLPGIQAMIDFLAQGVAPKAKGHKAAEFVDLRFLG
ncbi:MAG TPA: ABC transporter substrate-binding protein [Chloroflexota bacterium]|nr:ABC transporter substrate-binding protein [Chloroflexota bacterium]